MACVYNAAIIGCGWIAMEAPDNHARAYSENPQINLIGLCDIDISKAHKYREKYYITQIGVSPAHFVEMIYWCLEKKKLDIVSVCTPVETHCKIVCDIAPYVKAIYCEKPMATTLEECDKMIEACKKYNVILQINHQREFTRPKMRFSRDLIDTGTHAFSLLAHTFGMIEDITKDTVTFYSGRVIDIDYIPTQEHIFELDYTHNTEPMIGRGVQNLVDLLDSGYLSSNDVDGKLALEWALKYKEFVENG